MKKRRENLKPRSDFKKGKGREMLILLWLASPPKFLFIEKKTQKNQKKKKRSFKEKGEARERGEKKRKEEKRGWGERGYGVY